MSGRRAPLIERLLDKVEPSPDGCWRWTGATYDNGYGAINLGPRVRVAHRVLYEIVVGPVADGLVLDHTCHDPARCVNGPRCPHRACVNPDHLEPVLLAENVRRGACGEGRSRHELCRDGHPITVSTSGRRLCEVCHRADSRRRTRARRTPT